MELANLDFQQARIKQVLFKSRLRSVLYGVREADAALFSARENPLGEWLHTIVKPKYGRFGEVQQLEQLVQQMLDAGAALVQQYQRGQIEEARGALSRIDSFADQIEATLYALEQKVAAGRRA